MIEQPQVPDGCRVIPLWRNVGWDNFHPIYEIIDYTIVDEIDFDRLNKHRWFMYENRSGDRYAVRKEHQGKKTITILMSREVLNLPHGIGHGGEGDHVDHNTLNNKRENLRVATCSQNAVNRGRRSSSQRFKGVSPNGSQYRACIGNNGLAVWFTSVPTDIEAGLMYNYAAIILHDKFATLNIIPEDKMPSKERCWELMGMVVEKLRLFGYI